MTSPSALSYRAIPLTKNQIALVDAEDFERLKHWKWSASARSCGGFVAVRGSEKRLILMHRAILDAPKGMLVDHINHNPLDNRRRNLRLASAQENNRNQRMRSDNSSGFKGVSWNSRRRRWYVFVSVNGKSIFAGSAESAEQGARLYDAKAAELFGSFALLNFPTK